MGHRDTLQILVRAREAAQKHAGLVLGPLRPFQKRQPSAADGLLDIQYQGERQQYVTEIRPVLHHAGIPLIAERARQLGQPLLLIASFITTAQGRALKAAGVQFLDTTGNCSLVLPGLHTFILGNKPESGSTPSSHRGLSAAAVRLVFHYLTDSSGALLNRPYREITRFTGVALGTVTSTRVTLDSLGFLAETPDGLRLTDRRELLERWVVAYADRLRPKLVTGRYGAPVADWWKNVTLDPAVALWGGEPAAARLTRYLKPEIITLYRFANLNRFLLEHDLRVDPEGNVEILDAFWKSPDLRETDCVHPLLAYADLMAGGIDRNIETARTLYDQRLAQLVETP